MERIETPEEFREFVDEIMDLGWRDQEFPCEGANEIAYAKVAARDAAIRAKVDKLECERDHLVEAARRYVKAYGPGYSTTDTLAYDAITGVLNAICRKEVVG